MSKSFLNVNLFYVDRPQSILELSRIFHSRRLEKQDIDMVQAVRYVQLMQELIVLEAERAPELMVLAPEAQFRVRRKWLVLLELVDGSSTEDMVNC